MEPTGHITGFDVAIGTNEASTYATISVTSGAILWPPGQVQQVNACSVSVSKQAAARRVRVFLHAFQSDPLAFRATRYAPAVDSDQDTPRGYYSDQLVVVGHADIPALPKAPLAANLTAVVSDTRERMTLLKIIRALDVMAKLPPRGATSAIEKQLQELGFTGPKDATIRSVLGEARKLEPDQ